MTACVNRKHTKKVAAVVTASLVGALSLGAAPVAAVAEDTGIETQSVSEQKAWANGSVTYAHDNQGYIIEDPSNIEFVYDGDVHFPKVLEVTPKGATKAVRVSQANVKYFSGNHEVSPSAIRGIGTYTMQISAPWGSEYAGGTLEVEFRIVSKSLEGTQIYDASNGDVSDTTFTYTGKTQQIGFLLDGHKVADGDVFDVTYYVAGTDTVVSSIVDAGNYVAVLEGKGSYTGSEVQIPFTVGKLDLSSANITMPDLTYVKTPTNPQQATVNGVVMGTTDLKFTWVGAEDGSKVLKNKTTYTYTVAPTNSDSANMTGSKQVTFSIVDIIIANNQINYCGTPLDGQSDFVNIDDAKSYFDLDDITVSFTEPSVTITNAAGEQVDEKTVNSVPGNYTVSVRVDAKANDYKYGSDTVTMKVRTRKGTVDAEASVYFRYKGTVVDHIEPITYTGANILDDISTLVECGGATLEEGTDYTVVVKDQNGQTVDSIVDAGIYHVIVASDIYELTGDCELTVVVKPFAFNKVYIGSDEAKTFTDEDGTTEFIPYSGNAASYYFYYLDGDNKEVRIPEGVIELDHFYYTNEDGKTVDADEVKGIGTYKASIKIAAGVTNYVFLGEETENTLTVGEGKVFSDVSADKWYAEPVYQAKEQGYINGFAGTTLFGPEKNITRGDVACVLFNMSGAPKAEVSTDMSQQWVSYATKFNDVDGGAYYAKAIGWAAKLGIVNGYGDQVTDWAEDRVAWAVANKVMGNGGFLAPTSAITRAEVAAMAVNYQPEALSDADLI
ncbi:S-layer homology domain-containing protein [Collinsella tanakaei]|nr:S-layer homology domain-containing protein [Collinsella tanakaei]